ncbi:MAG: crossover junction endodeoxyribonuclease RuvC [Candidatus Staskawiczbacteria bacterium RIFCSPHIGHO2_02_FULL_43_16]|uniref:Crossover junction endodeoxyribonuclease RuvC n=1 Tax=Candidatus Staskawiczbacteria bacterium RIFCSPHIGHO2_01_FULL_41_41 TaxID=1802203 RepID=A0A1G2HXF2_9BACT|nr:MAG: crossover junction endodeoxyribonuclease RuvC [Candidatus Staskawiczbacteria bacterium RIFCSPHIGHO2_01_FULL_41_41]OGZ68953.1 MAG: crossover junction endodeoxyribonuclease RuvC [Candidatus Staskawiczbacteria bacterium RIFCSPHIGHO2_02_FULL_43_16]OGZ74865.1 MAG: crossover junction endodeoxyribonuclease RuvC [Candidatus Staskawiczbacteria bacterium RIFCSPLOWO2_01_FULL_43_17b]
MIILGVDPGVALMGYAIIKTNVSKHLRQDRNEKPKVIDFGCITTTKFDSPGDRLNIIHKEIGKLIDKHKPDLISIESLFFFKNLKTAMPVSQAKGVILLAAAQKKIPVMEFTPLQVKMTVVGYGRAEKKQVQEMTKQLLDMDGFDHKTKGRKKDDAADALGIALCAVLGVRDPN